MKRIYFTKQNIVMMSRSTILKTIFAILILLPVLTTNAISQDIPFRAERMITDFRGVVANKNIVLCYGDYGIITYSSDISNTWNQLNLGDKYNILKIRNFNDDFYGATQYSLLKSTNNGLNWINKEIVATPDLVGMAMVDKNIYVLTKNSIFTSDLELNLTQNKIIELDTFSVYKYLETDSKFLYFVSDNKYLMKYDIASDKLDTIDFTKILTWGLDSIVGIKIIDSSIYVQTTKSIVKDDIYQPYSLYQSTDYGINWTRQFYSYSRRICFNFFDNEKRYIRMIERNVGEFRFLTTEYLKIDSSHYQTDSSYITIINDKDSIERSLSSSLTAEYNEIIQTNGDTLIAVGVDKLISVSYNKGEKWELKSIFESKFFSNAGSPPNYYFIDKDLIYLNRLTHSEIFKTNNGGITWLPQKSLSDRPMFNTGLNSFIYNKTGTGKCFFGASSNNDSIRNVVGNILWTDNYGETYKSSLDTISPFPYNQKCIFSMGNEYLFYNPNGNIRSTIYILNENYNLIYSVKLDSIEIAGIIGDKDATIYCIGIKYSNKIDNDSVMSNKGIYVFLKSINRGRNWVMLDSVPHIDNLLYWNKKNHDYRSKGFNDYSLFANKIILDYIEVSIINQIQQIKKQIYTIDTETKKLDSLNIYHGNVYFGYNFHRYDNTLFVYINDDTLVYNDHFSSDISKWDTLRVKDFLFDWNKTEKNSIISYLGDKKAGFFITGKSIPKIRSYDPDLLLNFVKLSPTLPISVEDNKIEMSNYFYSFPPYPIPVTNGKVRSMIYWDLSLDIDKDEIGVYNIKGEKVCGRERITIEKLNGYSGYLDWDCSNFINGTYLIQIKHGTRLSSLKILINR